MEEEEKKMRIGWTDREDGMERVGGKRKWKEPAWLEEGGGRRRRREKTARAKKRGRAWGLLSKGCVCKDSIP